MKAGLSTACLYPLETEKALEQLIARGFSRFELFLNATSELDTPLSGQLLELSRGREVVAVHPFTSGTETMLFFSNYPRRFRDGLELYRRFFYFAAQLGASFVVFHGARHGLGVPPQLYLQRYALLHQAAREEGVTLLQENVERCMSRDSSLFRLLRAHLPEAGFVLDLKQARRAGVPLEEMLDAMGEGLRYIHLSDDGPRGDCLPLGEGQLDIPGLLRSLARRGFDGCLTLELYSGSCGQPGQLERSNALLEEAIRSLG